MNTLSKEVKINGIGIHSGQEVEMLLCPSSQNGINFFFRNGTIPVNLSTVATNHIRSTQLESDGVIIQTPEHLLSACYALELTNIDIYLSESEVPILDGSSINFLEYLKPAVISLNKKSPNFVLTKDVHFEYNGSYYFASPADHYLINAVISYPAHWVKTMSFHYTHSYENYKSHIAPARTYGFTHEIEILKKNNLAKGGSLDNALVIGDEDYVNQPRFNDELVRHKILDFIGDMAILNQQFLGAFTIIKPSHQGNIEFLKFLANEFS